MYSVAAQSSVTGRLYPEREEPRLGKMDRFAAAVGGLFAPWVRPRPEHLRWIIESVHYHGKSAAAMRDDEILEVARTPERTVGPDAA